jgi:hypothetical protein
MNRQYLLSGHICIGMGMKSCFFLRFLSVLLQINFKESALSFFHHTAPRGKGWGVRIFRLLNLFFGTSARVHGSTEAQPQCLRRMSRKPHALILINVVALLLW